MLENQPSTVKVENANSQQAEQAEKVSLESKIATLKKQDNEVMLAIALLEVGIINSIAHSTNTGLNIVKMLRFKSAAIKIRIKNLQLRLTQLSKN